MGKSKVALSKLFMYCLGVYFRDNRCLFCGSKENLCVCHNTVVSVILLTYLPTQVKC